MKLATEPEETRDSMEEDEGVVLEHDVELVRVGTNMTRSVLPPLLPPAAGEDALLTVPSWGTFVEDQSDGEAVRLTLEAGRVLLPAIVLRDVRVLSLWLPSDMKLPKCSAGAAGGTRAKAAEDESGTMAAMRRERRRPGSTVLIGAARGAPPLEAFAALVEPFCTTAMGVGRREPERRVGEPKCSGDDGTPAYVKLPWWFTRVCCGAPCTSIGTGLVICVLKTRRRLSGVGRARSDGRDFG